MQECDCTFQVFSFSFCLVNKILGEDFYFSNIKVYNWQLRLTLGRFGATKKRFENVFKLISSYENEEEKYHILEIFDKINDIERLCSDKNVVPEFIQDTSENLKTIKLLFEKLFDETFDEKNLFKNIDDCSLYDHYQKFKELNKICPFCGIEKYSDRGVKPRQSYDHYLHESEYFLAGVNLNNLVPMCYKCNANGNKGSKDILFEYNENKKTNKRRLAYYPYKTVAGVKIDISYVRDFELEEMETFLTALIPIDENEAEKVATWNEVFNLTARLNARIKEEQKTWIEDLIEQYFEKDVCNEKSFREASEKKAAKLANKIQTKSEAVLESAFLNFLARTEHTYLIDGYCELAKSPFAEELERRKESLYK